MGRSDSQKKREPICNFVPDRALDEGNFYGHKDRDEHRMRANIFTSSLPPTFEARKIPQALVCQNRDSLGRLTHGETYLAVRRTLGFDAQDQPVHRSLPRA